MKEKDVYTVGKTNFYIPFIKKLTYSEFVEKYKGKIDVDINDLWTKITGKKVPLRTGKKSRTNKK